MKNKIIAIFSFLAALLLNKINYSYLSYQDILLLTLNPGLYLGSQVSISQILISNIALYIFVLMIFGYIDSLFKLEIYIFSRGQRSGTIKHYVYKTLCFCNFFSVVVVALYGIFILMEGFNGDILTFLIWDILTLYILGTSVLLIYVLAINRKNRRYLPIMYFLFCLLMDLFILFGDFELSHIILAFNRSLVPLLFIIGLIVIVSLVCLVYKRYLTIDRLGTIQ